MLLQFQTFESFNFLEDSQRGGPFLTPGGPQGPWEKNTRMSDIWLYLHACVFIYVSVSPCSHLRGFRRQLGRCMEVVIGVSFIIALLRVMHMAA